MDGATRWQQFTRITFPSLKDTHYIVLALSLIESFKVFDLVYAMTYGGPGYSTQVMGTWMYANVFQYFNAGYGTAIAVVITIVRSEERRVGREGKRRGWTEYERRKRKERRQIR